MVSPQKERPKGKKKSRALYTTITWQLMGDRCLRIDQPWFDISMGEGNLGFVWIEYYLK